MAAALPALVAQLRPDDELVIVDNGSMDGTRERFRALAPAARVLEARPQRRLRGRGQRRRARRARRSAALPQPRRDAGAWVRGGHPRAAGRGARLGRLDGARDRRVRACGQHQRRRRALHRDLVGRRGRRRRAGQPDRPARGRVRVGRLPGGAACHLAAARRLPGALLHVPRGRRPLAANPLGRRPRGRRAGRGGRPRLRVRQGPAKWRRLERNRWATILRCYPAPLLALLAPALLATEFALLGAGATGGWLPQKLQADAETLAALPSLWRERRAVQATRRVSAGELAAWLTPDLDSPFLGGAGRSPLLRACLRAYWAGVVRMLGSRRRTVV